MAQIRGGSIDPPDMCTLPDAADAFNPTRAQDANTQKKREKVSSSTNQSNFSVQSTQTTSASPAIHLSKIGQAQSICSSGY